MDQASQLRNIIKMNAPKSSARVITVTSGKGGVGKSTVSINLAVEFKKQGYRVVIFDADFGLANIEVMFGAVPKHNLTDVIYKGHNISEVITQGPMDIGFVSGGCGIAQLSSLTQSQIEFLVENLAELDKLADVVIIDTGAGISGAVLDFLVASSEVLLVTTPEPTSITDSYSLLKALGRHPGYDGNRTKVKMIANRVDGDMEGRQLYQKLNAVVMKYLNVPLDYLGMVPQDQLLSKAVMQQSPVCIQNPNSKSARAFEVLTATLMNKEVSRSRFSGMSDFFANFMKGNWGTR